MKNCILFGLSILFFCSNSFAENLKINEILTNDAEINSLVTNVNATKMNQIFCHVNKFADDHDSHIVLFERLTALCDNGAMLSIGGFGPGVRLAFAADLELSCITNGEVRGEYYGIKATAALGFGLDLAVFANSNGVCFLAGLEGGLGAGITGAKMVLKNPSY